MDVHMFDIVFLARKLSSTLTVKWLCRRMHKFMAKKMMLATEGGRAHITDKWANIQVNFHMTIKSVLSSKLFLTLSTFKR